MDKILQESQNRPLSVDAVKNKKNDEKGTTPKENNIPDLSIKADVKAINRMSIVMEKVKAKSILRDS